MTLFPTVRPVFSNGWKTALLLFPMIGTFAVSAAAAPIHVTYLWHMHQPVYYPYESVNQTDANGRYNFNVAGVHGERAGNYTTWPKEAVEQGHNRAGLEHSGAQVSFSGSLGENLNGLWGDASSATWDDAYDYARNTLRTSLNNPRLDMVGIAYHHSLMPLTCKESMKMQIRLHKELYSELWNSGGGYSKGFWPPECAFAEWIIPALVEEGLEWVLVDNGHFDRACQNYPWVPATSVRPNPADQQNPDPATIGSTWVQLNNVWAPSKVSAPWGYQPHYVKYVNPWTGAEQKMIAVPCGRYEGNENGRGGYGAFKPENVWGSQIAANNNAARPMLIVCHSDGDNYGMKNADAFHGQHGNFLNMCQSNGDFDNTSVQDYLTMYPVPTNDVIHVEPGSWVGIDGGTPFFDKWRENNAGGAGDPNEHPDFWSWSVIVAAQNRVLHADKLENSYSMNDVQWGIGADTAKAWHYYLQGETSCHWYWDYDRANPWDGNATRACNLAVTEANKVLARHPGSDPQPPSIFPPQRSTYNPGGYLYNEPARQPSDFAVWSFVDDVSGLGAVRLYWRADLDNQNPIAENDNEVYAHNPARVGAWNVVTMTNAWYPLNRGPQVPNPSARAQRWTGWITGQNNVLLDYFVEAVDAAGNTNRSDILHVYVGASVAGPTVAFSPHPAEVCKPLVVTYDPANRPLSNATPVYLNITFNNFATPASNFAMTASGAKWVFTNAIPAGATNAIVYFSNSGATIYDNNTNANWSVAIGPCSTGPATVVSFDPPAPNGCGNVTIHYSPNYGVLKGATNILIHIGRNGWQDTVQPDPVMANTGTGTWTYVFTNLPGTYRIDCVFNNGGGQWDNNQGVDYRVNVTNCGSPFALSLVPGSPVIADDPATQNQVGEAFDFNPAGGAASTTAQGGFGSFGQVYLNYDATNLYLGARGVDMVGDNNGMVVFLGVNTLSDNANNLWAKEGAPRGLDQMHNLWLNQGMDVAIVLGDEWGDGTYPSFNLGNGYDFGQGVFYLSATSFVPVAGARLAQFDGTGTNATLLADGDTNRLTDRWEVAIPWASLNATSVADLTALHIAGVIASDGTNGVDRYLSGNVLAQEASTKTNGNYGFGFLTLTAIPVGLPSGDVDGDGLPDAWEETHFHGPGNGHPNDDDDGDGQSNLEEYWLGTQPTNAASLLEMAGFGSATGGQRQVSWRAVGGKRYQVEATDDLLAGFAPLVTLASTNAAPGAETLTTFEDPASTNAARAYRVRLSP